jgi:hypothetical protein
MIGGVRPEGMVHGNGLAPLEVGKMAVAEAQLTNGGVSGFTGNIVTI